MLVVKMIVCVCE